MSVVVKACPTCDGAGEVQHPAQAHRNVAPWNEITVPCPDPACDNGQVVDDGMDDEALDGAA